MISARKKSWTTPRGEKPQKFINLARRQRLRRASLARNVLFCRGFFSEGEESNERKTAKRPSAGDENGDQHQLTTTLSLGVETAFENAVTSGSDGF